MGLYKKQNLPKGKLDLEKAMRKRKQKTVAQKWAGKAKTGMAAVMARKRAAKKKKIQLANPGRYAMKKGKAAVKSIYKKRKQTKMGDYAHKMMKKKY